MADTNKKTIKKTNEKTIKKTIKNTRAKTNEKEEKKTEIKEEIANETTTENDINVKAYFLKDDIEERLVKVNFEDWDKYSISFLVSIFQYKQYEEFYEGNLSLLKKYIDWARNNQDKVYGKNMYKYDTLVKIYHMINDDLFYNRKYDYIIDLNNLEMKNIFLKNNYDTYACDFYTSGLFQFSSGFFIFSIILILIFFIISFIKKFIILIYKKIIFKKNNQNTITETGSFSLNLLVSNFLKKMIKSNIPDFSDLYKKQDQSEHKTQNKKELDDSLLDNLFNNNIDKDILHTNFKDLDENTSKESSLNDLLKNNDFLKIIENIKENFRIGIF